MVVADDFHMSRALALAERGCGRTSPNPMVGAVVVDPEGVVVGQGAHEIVGGPHAEMHALAEAGERARGATLYCTLEPCTHTGRTGPCAPQVVAAGIRRAVVAVRDPNPLAAGGVEFLRRHGIEVTVGVCADRAADLNRGFFTRVRRGRPFVTMKVALTLDGCVAAGPGSRTPLTGAAANRYIHRERAAIDALAVGSGTVLADDPLLTPRGAYRYRPLIRVVFDRRLRTPADARLLSTLGAGPVIIMSTPSAARQTPERIDSLTHAGVRLELVPADEHEPAAFLEAALLRLAALDCSSVIVEGGPTLHHAFWRAQLVDRVQMFVTPAIAGPRGVRWDVLPVGTMGSLTRQVARPIGDDVLIEGYVHRAD